MSLKDQVKGFRFMDITGRKQILCVDDSLDSCTLLSFILARAGYEVETTQTQAQALEIAQKNNFVLHIVDLSLADGSGLELIQTIHQLNTKTPIIACSGDVRTSTQEQAKQAGATLFLAKPIDPLLLVETVGKCLIAL
jgi:two-component system, NtrC family, response regulator HydG